MATYPRLLLICGAALLCITSAFATTRPVANADRWNRIVSSVLSFLVSAMSMHAHSPSEHHTNLSWRRNAPR